MSCKTCKSRRWREIGVPFEQNRLIGDRFVVVICSEPQCYMTFGSVVVVLSQHRKGLLSFHKCFKLAQNNKNENSVLWNCEDELL